MPAPDHPLHEALFHYYCEFDATGLIASHAVPDLEGQPGTVTNFLGVRVPVSVHPPILAAMDGTVEGLPFPGNWHADIAEWAGALRAVEAAHETFRIVELGCGWGCWLVNMGMAARTKGLTVDLIGIEGDTHHLESARATLDLNGLDARLFHGVAGPKRGKAIFPDPEEGRSGWGGEAIFYPKEDALGRAQQDPSVQVLDCYPLSDLAQGNTIDLLHVDIQGAEVDYVDGNLPALQASVRRVLIGTHSRAIEGRLHDMLTVAGWQLEMERPAIAPLQNGQPVIAIDGVQMWVNPALVQDSGANIPTKEKDGA